MKISHFKVTPFSIPFVKPLKTSGMIYTHREGVWIKLKCANFTGVGEASPLPGFSTETLKEVRYALEGFHQAIDREDLDREELFLLLEIHSQNTPSVRFALETAIYDILAKEEELPLAKYLNNKANVEILVNGLVGVHQPGEGFSVMKVKVGFRNLFDEIENMEYLTKSFGEDI